MSDTLQPIKGYEGRYFAGTDGYIYSARLGGRLKGRADGGGYLGVVLCKYGNKRPRKVHRLIAESFIPNPYNKPCVNHKDGDRQNNCISNLEWVTHKENSLHAGNRGTMSRHGENNGRAKLSTPKIANIKKSYCLGESVESLSIKYGVSLTAIYKVLNGTNWR